MNERKMTFGERAVGLTFNPSGEPLVHELKASAALFIEHCHQERELTKDPEVKRMYSLAITAVQEAQMWAVKAATWRP